MYFARATERLRNRASVIRRDTRSAPQWVLVTADEELEIQFLKQLFQR
jgi:hypothetical protein